ncbi:hypothetical protein D3C78_1121300 [compost metagenome]
MSSLIDVRLIKAQNSMKMKNGTASAHCCPSLTKKLPPPAINARDESLFSRGTTLVSGRHALPDTHLSPLTQAKRYALRINYSIDSFIAQLQGELHSAAGPACTINHRLSKPCSRNYCSSSMLIHLISIDYKVSSGAVSRECASFPLAPLSFYQGYNRKSKNNDQR